ncbi:hypothetical protein L1D14_07350 [Vibrio tubiashii]|uniref:hypothetical protein n=1 Tax=Vibrio tubiashii TaxID=29498 RepID=UPI001EFE65F8|nr:hypothetical protein [Vibrio tubiashii]MCG9576053.1 hypothetical protein [Vibrio tubiashii]
MPIPRDQEHQLKLDRVEVLMGKLSLSSQEESELHQLFGQVQAYETVHSSVALLSETVISAINWHNPVGSVPSDWNEKWTIIGLYTLRVWLSTSGYFEASLTHNETNERFRLDIGQPEDLKSACDTSAEVAVKCMT